LVKDGEQFIDIAKKIKEKDPDMKVSLLCSDNICSKTVTMLEKAGIDVLIGGEEEEI
jgi:lipoate synthase